tara:strand:+ start:1179 stop:3098 length:1920 start_codon:yes stop_codon:yes gene_type:complete
MADYVDIFNRADASPIGGDWVTEVGSGLQIVSNAVKSVVVAGPSVSSLFGQTFQDDQTAEIEIGVYLAFDFIGVGARFDGSGSGYVVGTSSGSQISIYRVDSGVFTNLQDYTGLTIGSGDTIGIDVTGTAVEALHNGSSLGSVTDANHDSGAPAIYYERGDSNATTGDNFLATGAGAVSLVLTIDSTDATMAKQSTFGMTVSNPPFTPTASNTSLTLGAIQIPLSQATNTSGDIWDLEFPIGDIPRQADGTGYVWTLDVGTAVVANTAPVVSLVGNASIPLTVGDTYTEQGATVADSEDGVLAIGDPIFTPPLDLTTAGTYVATYSVTDSGGLVGTATRDVVVSASGGGGSITALGGVDFDGLTDGESITPLVSFYGAYGNGYGSQGDTSIAYGSNTSSASMSIQSGTTGRPGDGTPAGNGDFGFIESLTTAGHAVADGGDLWVYGKLFIPLGFDFSGAGGLGLKFLRFTFPGSGGKLDVHIGENGSGVNNSFSISNENFSQFQSDVHRETNRTLNLGAWNDFCFYVSATADTSTTEMRLWINDEFVMEHVGNGADITTNWTNPAGALDSATWTPAGGGFAALPNSGETISSMYLFTYWNGNAAQDQSVNVQYMNYVQTETGLATDAYGNKYVNSGQVS